MYLRKVHIENIRSIDELDWEIPEGQEAGWHVLIGDNGSGKSTFLRATALPLVGEEEAPALLWLNNWDDWLRHGEVNGQVELEYDFDPAVDDNLVFLTKPPRSSQKNTRKKTINATFFRDTKGSVRFSIEANLIDTTTPMWQSFVKGWFSAAYGPFRRFSGGDEGSVSIFHTKPRLAAHLSIFSEAVALTECLKWIRELKFRQLEQKPEGILLESLITFVNQEDFLPHQMRLVDVSSDGIFFTDNHGHQLPVEQLSDGYRSVLSMTFELIRQMTHFFDLDQIFSSDSTKIIAPGVVLIDEVDAHLHPTWQRRIGLWFREHFPNIQFIVTTHSPLVCQAAEHGTVFRLPAPGSGEKAKMVEGVELNRLLYGNVLDAYGTELFGEGVGRSDSGKKLLQELAVLNVKEVNQGLNKAEKKKQQDLRATFPTSSPMTNGHEKKGK